MRRRFAAFILRFAAAMGAMLALHEYARAGVTPEVSRVVFRAKSATESLQVFNVNAYPVLVQAWIDDGDVLASPQDSNAPIIVLPPIFRMDAGGQLSLRLVNSGAALPVDRESAYWLNLYEMPATPTRALPDEQRVTVTMRTQIKVFVRPDKLPYPPAELPKRLTFSLVPGSDGLTLQIGNPSPYYATIAGLQVVIGGATQTASVPMIAPFSRASVALQRPEDVKAARAQVVFSLVDDDGNAIAAERVVEVRNPD